MLCRGRKTGISGLGRSGRMQKDPLLNSNRGHWEKFCASKKLSRCKRQSKIHNPSLPFDLRIDCEIETYKVAWHVTIQRTTEEFNAHSLLLFLSLAEPYRGVVSIWKKVKDRPALTPNVVFVDIKTNYDTSRQKPFNIHTLPVSTLRG